MQPMEAEERPVPSLTVTIACDSSKARQVHLRLEAAPAWQLKLAWLSCSLIALCVVALTILEEALRPYFTFKRKTMVRLVTGALGLGIGSTTAMAFGYQALRIWWLSAGWTTFRRLKVSFSSFELAWVLVSYACYLASNCSVQQALDSDKCLWSTKALTWLWFGRSLAENAILTLWLLQMWCVVPFRFWSLPGRRTDAPSSVVSTTGRVEAVDASATALWSARSGQSNMWTSDSTAATGRTRCPNVEGGEPSDDASGQWPTAGMASHPVHGRCAHASHQRHQSPSVRQGCQLELTNGTAGHTAVHQAEIQAGLQAGHQTGAKQEARHVRGAGHTSRLPADCSLDMPCSRESDRELNDLMDALRCKQEGSLHECRSPGQQTNSGGDAPSCSVPALLPPVLGPSSFSESSSLLRLVGARIGGEATACSEAAATDGVAALGGPGETHHGGRGPHSGTGLGGTHQGRPEADQPDPVGGDCPAHVRVVLAVSSPTASGGVVKEDAPQSQTWRLGRGVMWPVLLVCGCTMGVDIALLVINSSNTWDGEYECVSNRKATVDLATLLTVGLHCGNTGERRDLGWEESRFLTIAEAMLRIVMGGMYVLYACVALKWLRQQSYQKHRAENMFMRVEMLIRGPAMVSMVVSHVLLAFGCHIYDNALVGTESVQTCLLVGVVGIALLYLPSVRSSLDDSDEHTLRECEQEFAWTEADRAVALAMRVSSLPVACDAARALSEQPMFCFETALKLMFWSSYAYGLEPDGLTSLGVCPEQLMDMFDLEDMEEVVNPAVDLSALLAWSSSTMVVAFRGTASLKNAWVDVKGMPVPHHSHNSLWCCFSPHVHMGFQSAWIVGEYQSRVIAQVTSWVQAARERGRPFKVYFTGHSLGGALAGLASYDCQRALALRPQQLSVYTFGAPRTGNHTFAKKYSSLVSDCWAIVNDDDVVPYSFKYLFPWAPTKHHGHRVVINARGDMIVRPMFAEMSLMRWPCQRSVMDHMLSSYRRAMLTVLQQQQDGGSKPLARGKWGTALLMGALEASWGGSGATGTAAPHRSTDFSASMPTGRSRHDSAASSCCSPSTSVASKPLVVRASEQHTMSRLCVVSTAANQSPSGGSTTDTGRSTRFTAQGSTFEDESVTSTSAAQEAATAYPVGSTNDDVSKLDCAHSTRVVVFQAPEDGPIGRRRRRLLSLPGWLMETAKAAQPSGKVQSNSGMDGRQAGQASPVHTEGDTWGGHIPVGGSADWSIGGAVQAGDDGTCDSQGKRSVAVGAPTRLAVRSAAMCLTDGDEEFRAVDQVMQLFVTAKDVAPRAGRAAAQKGRRNSRQPTSDGTLNV